MLQQNNILINATLFVWCHFALKLTRKIMYSIWRVFFSKTIDLIHDSNRYHSFLRVSLSKGVTRSCKSKMNRQYKVQRKRIKEQTTIYQNITQITEDRTTRTLPKTYKPRVNSRGWAVSAPHRITPATDLVISHECRKDQIIITTNGTYPWSFMKHNTPKRFAKSHWLPCDLVSLSDERYSAQVYLTGEGSVVFSK